MDRQDWIVELLSELDSESEEVRKSAVVWLSQSAEPEVLRHLWRATRDPSVAVRYFARRGVDAVLGRLEARPPAAPSDAGAMLRSVDPADRTLGALACCGRPRPELSQLLVELASRDGEARVRATAVQALGALREARLQPVLLGCLRDSDPRVRANAIEALGEDASPSALQAVEAARSDADNRVKANALVFVGLRNESEIRPDVETMLASGQMWQMDSAVFVLRRLGTEWCRARLRSLLEGPFPRALLPKVREALGILEPATAASIPPEGGAANPRATQEPGPGATLFTEQTLECPELGDLQAWARCLGSRKYRHRIHALQNARRFEDPRILPALRRLLELERHPYVVATLARALGELGDAADVPSLLQLLQSPSDRVRANAAEGLAALGAAEAARAAPLLLRDPSPRVRAAAARWLHGRDPTGALDALEGLVGSAEPPAIRATLSVLEQVEGSYAEEVVLRHLETGEKLARLNLRGVLEEASPASALARRVLARLARFAGQDRQERRSYCPRVALGLAPSTQPAPVGERAEQATPRFEPGVDGPRVALDAPGGPDPGPEHPSLPVRRRINTAELAALAELAVSGDQQAATLLELACHDRDSEVRAGARSVMTQAGLPCPEESDEEVVGLRAAAAPASMAPSWETAGEEDARRPSGRPSRKATKASPPREVSSEEDDLDTVGFVNPLRQSDALDVHGRRALGPRGALALAAAIPLLVALAVVSRGPGESPAERAPLQRFELGQEPKTLSVAALDPRADLARYVGLTVRERGRFVELSEDGKQARVDVKETPVLVCYEQPLPDELRAGELVLVEGVLQGRREGVLTLEGRDPPERVNRVADTPPR